MEKERMPIIKVALIGAGRMGRNHLRVLSQHKRFEVVGIVDPLFQRGVPSPFNSFRCVASIDELSRVPFDSAIVAAPTTVHLELIEQLVQRGKSVLAEKPICATSGECQSLSRLISDSGGRVYAGHVERFNPAVVKAQELLSVGALGKPIHFSFSRVGGRPSDAIGDNNVLLDLAVHDLDILRCLAGDFRVLSSVCHSTWKAGVYDTAEILLVGSAGCSASIHSNWISPTKIRTFRITGTRGVCLVDFMMQTCELFSGDSAGETPENFMQYSDLVQAYKSKPRTEHRVEQGEPLALQLEGFYQTLTGNSSRLCSAEDAIRAVELAEGALSMAQKFELSPPIE